MSDLMDKLTYLQETKALFKAKLGMADTVPFRDYVAAVPKVAGWSQAAYEATKSIWVRPSDWLAMPTMANGDQKVIILMPVYDDDASYATLTLAGAYTVDWGDGTVENFASGVAANHKYAYSALADATLTSQGFKQALIVATPQSGVDMTSVTLNRSTSAGRPSRYLDVKMAGQKVNNFMLASLSSLKKFEYIGTNAIISFSSVFSRCSSLAMVPQLDTSKGTSFSNMFYDCSALTTIPQLDTSKETNFSNMFQGCSALASVPQLDTSNGTNFSYMFSGCRALTTVPQLDTHNGTSFASMFQACYALASVPQLDTSNGTNFSYMFYNCFALTTIPSLNTSNGTNFDQIFTVCPALSRSRMTGTKYAISYANCSLSRQSILEIFNNLGTASGTQTISVSSNPGAASLTADDKAIATAKGWTVAA